MTLLFGKDKECAICHNISDHSVIGSTNTQGSPDLDTRPSEMMRSTMYTWIQICPTCNYCSTDISEGESTIIDIINSEYYKNILSDERYSELANKFRCQGMILESQSNYSAAAWAYLHASWDCDDENYDSGAIKCRNSASALFAKVKEMDKDFSSDNCTYYALQTDISRRSGQFEIAMDYCNTGLQMKPDENIHQLLLFEMELINRRDMKCYTMDAIPNN